MILLLKKNWYVEMRDGSKLDLAVRLKWSNATATGINNIGRVIAIAVVPEFTRCGRVDCCIGGHH